MASFSMKITPQEIIQFIKAKSDHPMKLKELAHALGLAGSDYASFRNAVKQLIATGELVKLNRGRIGIAEELSVRVGTLSVAKGGFGFLMTEGNPDDLFIPQSNLLTALDGDKVMARIDGKDGKRQTGTIIKIVERGVRNIVGLFKKSDTFSFVVPDNKKIQRDIYIPLKLSLNAEDGQKVVCVITEWDDPFRNPEGEITEILGFVGQPRVDMMTVLKSYDLPEAFPQEVLDEAEVESAKLDEITGDERLDLTGECIYTIDPFDARDHDDAISVEKTDKRFKLAVHIADVSHYVTEGSQLDKEAFTRGNSVYLPGMVVPMLPEILSNNICSLQLNKKRLAHSIFMEFDQRGKMLEFSFADTIIKSKAKLSYEDVEAYFVSGEVTEKIKIVKENLDAARELAKILTYKRTVDGSLDFDLPESNIILDEKGEVIELAAKVRLESHRLVEECMLAANQAVALHVFRNAQPFLYRVHEKPDTERLNEFSTLMKRIGFSFPVSSNMKPKLFARFLEKVKDEPKADFINELLLRSMSKAVYQQENLGHFGLAFKHYTHFTSPIRRYADLVVHRLLRKLKNGKYPHAYAKKVSDYIDKVSKQCSATERVATKAERDAIKIKQISFMADQVGEEFEGVITGVMSYGFFVRLDDMGVEGMVRMSTIDDDYYVFDEAHYRIVGKRHGTIYQLGDKVRVGILKVDTTSAEMDLFVVMSDKQKSKKKKVAKETLQKKSSSQKYQVKKFVKKKQNKSKKKK